jgi:sugar lactone lactonase YvrE
VRILPLVVIVAIALAGCSAGTQLSPSGAASSALQKNLAAVNGRTVASQLSRKSWMKPNLRSPVLYVSDSQNNYVDLYDVNGLTLEGQIASDHPTGLATDQSKNLYVTNLLAGNTTIYAFGRTKPSLTLIDPGAQPDDVAVGNDGTVYVEDENGQTYVYPKGATQPTTSLVNSSLQSGTAVSVDGHNDVLAAGFAPGTQGIVIRYAKASEPGVDLNLSPLPGPDGIAIAERGQIVIADFFLPGIQVFKPKGGAALRVFGQDASPNRLTFDKAKKTLYVPETNSNINIYNYKSGKQIKTLVGPSGSVMIGAAIVPAPRN